MRLSQEIARLARGFEQQYEDASELSSIDPSIAKLLVQSGWEDGDKRDDKIQVSKGSWAAAALKPSQTSMVLEKAVGMALFMLKTGKVGGDLGALVSKDRHIMDGHHRWAATILASGKSGKVGGYGAALKGAELLRVLNLLTVGVFHIRNGKPGKGNLGSFTETKVRKMLLEMTVSGIRGEFPWSADDVKEVLESSFGSVEDGIAEISGNAKLVTKTVPSWAPDRRDMPVIDPGNVPKAVGLMEKGVIDWNDPYTAE